MSEQSKLQQRVTSASQAQPPAPAGRIMRQPGRSPDPSDSGEGQPNPGPGITAHQVRDIDSITQAGGPPPGPPPHTQRIAHRGARGKFKARPPAPSPAKRR
jgi:hypothetical protein